jgi:hypothetical protein
MKATQFLHNPDQSMWLDNITCDLLDKGRLTRYNEDLSATGLTSNWVSLEVSQYRRTTLPAQRVKPHRHPTIPFPELSS